MIEWGHVCSCHRTLKLARKLEAGGFTPQQAAAAAEALAESLADATADMATKADIADVRRDLRETEFRLEARITTTVADAKAVILKRMFGAMAAQTGLIVALIKLLPAAG
ncbi:MAG: hypothetical protein RKK15_10605 [Defluviicoccus sp.]|nr:hypothetical protein [Defluviicoccus sp.]